MSERPRRDYGDGRIEEYATKSGPRFRIVWREPKNYELPELGTRRGSHGGFTSRREAQSQLRKEIGRVENRQPAADRSAITLRTFLEEFLAGHRVHRTTAETYAKSARLYIYPHLGDRKLASIRPETLAALYRKLEQEGGKNGRPLGPSTVAKVHEVLSVALGSPTAVRLIGHNPAVSRLSKPPTANQVKAARKPVPIWTLEQLDRFLAWNQADDTDEYRFVWQLLAETGIRRGELTAIKWENIDLRAGTLRVVQASAIVHEKDGTLATILKPVKGYRARAIDLLPSTINALKAHRDLVAKRYGFAAIHGDRFVMQNLESFSAVPQQANALLNKTINAFLDSQEGAGAPRVTMHGLRHSHATHLFIAGVQPKVVQERLGHASTEITQAIYTHMMPTTQLEALSKLQALRDQTG